MFTIKIKKSENQFTRFQINSDLSRWLNDVEKMYNEDSTCDGYVCYLDFPIINIVNPSLFNVVQYLNVGYPLTILITNETSKETTIFKNAHIREILSYDKDHLHHSNSMIIEFEFQTITKLTELKGKINEF